MFIRSSVFFLTFALSAPLLADADRQHREIAGLGELNGIALQCKYIDQVRRMKAAVVTHAPKQRSFGLAFDQATNDAFLVFTRNAEACPGHDALMRRVGHQIDRIAAAFASP